MKKTVHGVIGLESNYNAMIMREAHKERAEKELENAKERVVMLESMGSTKATIREAEEHVSFLQDKLLQLVDENEYELNETTKIFVPKGI